ncbi:MAG: hypothetical protein IK080_11410 [Clostridia bacterium]|nr:hypothetical protein [Clostridia bacterium]
MRKLAEYTVCALLGAAGYGALELAVRGRTHWTMTLLAGAVMPVLSLIMQRPPRSPFLLCGLGAAVITAFEFAAGMIVNVALGWQIWSYAGLPLNYKGQICAQYAAAWFVLSLPAFALCRAVRRSFRAGQASR